MAPCRYLNSVLLLFYIEFVIERYLGFLKCWFEKDLLSSPRSHAPSILTLACCYPQVTLSLLSTRWMRTGIEVGSLVSWRTTRSLHPSRRLKCSTLTTGTQKWCRSTGLWYWCVDGVTSPTLKNLVNIIKSVKKWTNQKCNSSSILK